MIFLYVIKQMNIFHLKYDFLNLINELYLFEIDLNHEKKKKNL